MYHEDNILQNLFSTLIFYVGGFGAWSIVVNAFISDISQPQDRSMRFGLLKLSETLGKPLGALLGNYILNEGLIAIDTLQIYYVYTKYVYRWICMGVFYGFFWYCYWINLHNY